MHLEQILDGQLQVHQEMMEEIQMLNQFLFDRLRLISKILWRVNAVGICYFPNASIMQQSSVTQPSSKILK